MASSADMSTQSMQDRRRELLRARIAESGAAATRSVELPEVRAGHRYPLSAGQRRLWFLQTLDPADTTLNIGVAYRLRGALDVARLRDAVNAVVARHTALRTTFGVDDAGEPFQWFHADAEVGWQVEQAAEQQVAALTAAAVGRAFDLTREVPLRITLLRTGADEWVLVVVVHHICWDDDCWEVFFAEVSAAYRGQPPGAGPAAQFVAVLTAPAAPADADLDYWRRTLLPLPAPVELPGSPAAAPPSRRAERRTRKLPAGLFHRVESLAREHSATPFMVLLAAFGVLVRRYTGAADFLVAVPVTDRPAGARDAIGYFGNTLLLRVGADGGFGALLDAVKDTCLSGFAHQHVGIDRVVGAANPDRTPGRDGLNELVQLGFSLRKSTTGLDLDGLSVSQLDPGGGSAPVPLALAVVVEPDGVTVEFEYQSRAFSGALVEQMLGHYLRLLDGALQQPGRRVTALDMLDAGERAGVLAHSHGELVHTPATTMVAVLEAAAAATPDAVAVVAETEPAGPELSYVQLHGRANRLARWLIGKGVGTEDIIGLRMDASAEFVVAVLAVWKAGAAYLPIDPAYPEERTEFLIADTNPYLVIGREGLAAAEVAAAGLPDTALSDAERIRPLRPANLAYVIYTSGSTGRPKGVAVTHRAIAEHLAGFIAEWQMTAADRLLQTSSVSFDASVPEMFMTLSIGARLVVPPTGTDIGRLAELIERHGVTVLHMVPSMLATLLLLPQADRWRGLRMVPVGGEALPGQVADAFTDRFTAELRNHYGPTEAVVCATHTVVRDRHGAAVVPIGVPNRNVYTYVLDAELAPVPAGVVGELYLGGAQLARGYHGRAALTAQRFVADPFSPGQRLYRTGDLVRRNDSGELEFVGRSDEQVKVRGYRIELGEVEAVIATHPAVRHCLVVVADGEAGPTLAAYLVPEVEVDLDEIRAHAAAQLPDYMVPSGFAVIPQIPLTIGGKLDKRALPAPTRITEAARREPATATERRVAAIFTALFGGEPVGAQDSFFTLGGHSLLAARLVAQIRAEFGVDLSVRAVFDTPTPAGLAAQLVELFRSEFDIDLDELETGAAEVSGDAPGRPALAAADRPERLPLSHSQLAAWLQHRLEGPQDGFNLPLALHIDGPLDAAALTAALGDVVARHQALRTTFAEHDGEPYQIVHPALPVELAVRRVQGDAEIPAAVAQLRREVLIPEVGPLLRATLLAVDASTHVLFVIVHHLVADHASLGVIFSDLITAYRARLAGTAPAWAELALQFPDYALWQRQAVTDSWGQAELTYWRDALAGLPEEVSVGTDYARPPVLGKRGEVATFTLPAAGRDALTRLAEQQGATEFMVYQAAVAVLLHTLGGGDDIVIGSPVASRVDPATANLVGLFANVVVLRTDVSADPSPRTVIDRSRERVLAALAHQELPIERLVEALNPPRSRSRNPLFVNMVHFHGPDWALRARDLAGDTTVVPHPIGFDVALLDLDIGVTVTSAGELEVRVVANADLYQPATVRSIADALAAVLDGFAAAPDAPVSQLSVLPTAELDRLLAAPGHRAAAPMSAAGSAETEQALIDGLQELLEITGVDRDDNFFALGGDSIIAIKWAARTTAAGLALTPAMVFEHMTIGELAAAVDGAGAAAVDAAGAAGHNGPPGEHSAPMSASGLDDAALAALTAAWEQAEPQP